MFKHASGEIWNGDCLELMRNIPDGSVDMVVTDPPYTMTKTGNSCRPDYMPNGEILDGVVPNLESWMKECFRVLRSNSHFYTFCNLNDLQIYLNTASKVGFKLHNLLHMIKDTKMPNRWYLKYTEILLFFRKGKAFAINNMTSRDYEIVNMPTQSNGKFHPTQKPLSYIQKIIENSSDKGDTILDPFGGSGTTAVAAHRTGRRSICIERDLGYYLGSCGRVWKEQQA